MLTINNFHARYSAAKEELAAYGYELGFTHIASGPLVRSSYHADVSAEEAGIHEVEAFVDPQAQHSGIGFDLVAVDVAEML